jgi:hypothetical protein
VAADLVGAVKAPDLLLGRCSRCNQRYHRAGKRKFCAAWEHVSSILLGRAGKQLAILFFAMPQL